MSTNSTDRIYRPVEPSDLPRIQAGTLKAFYQEPGRVFPVNLVSTRMFHTGTGGKLVNMWIVHYDDNDSYSKGDTYIVVDVTPEKRYAIWNHKTQRFVGSVQRATDIFGSKTHAEVYLEEMAQKYAMTDEYRKRYYIVEWEIKDVV